jgi:hypothetical protein
VRRVDRPQDCGNAGRVLERRGEAAAILALDPGRAAFADAVERLDGVVHVCGQTRHRCVPGPDALGEQAPQVVEAGAGLGGDDDERRVPHAVRGEEPSDVGTPGVDVLRGEKIGLVEDDRHRLPVRGERTQIAVVQRRVGVFLRLHDPGDEVREPHDAIDFEPVCGLDRVEVGEVDEHEAVQAVGGEPVATRDLEPVEQRIGAVPPDGSLARGRRRAAAANSRQRLARKRVEKLRLARTRRAGESDHRRLEAETQPLSRPGHDLPGALHGAFVEPPLREVGRLAERGQALVEIPLHAARRMDSTAPWRRAKDSASGTASSRRASKRAASSRKRRSTRAKRSSRACAASVRTA